MDTGSNSYRSIKGKTGTGLNARPLQWGVPVAMLSLTFILWWNISTVIGVVFFRMTMPLFIEYEGSLNALMSMKMMWIICYGLRSHQISTHLNTNGRFWTLDSTLYHHQQNTKWGNIFWKNGVHPSSRVSKTCRINTKLNWSCSGGMCSNTLLRHFMLVLPLICQPFVCSWALISVFAVQTLPWNITQTRQPYNISALGALVYFHSF